MLVLNKEIFFVFAGVLIDFISIPVTVGFTSATSVIIVVSQLKGLLGLKISSQGFLDTLTKIIQNIHLASVWDTAMSFSCIIILLLFRVIRICISIAIYFIMFRRKLTFPSV